MSEIRTRPSIGKRCGNQTQSFVEIWERISHFKNWLKRIVSVRKDSKNIEESGVAYVRKVKHRSQSYSPVKERKNMITQNFNTGRLVSTKKPPTQHLLPLWKITLGQGLSLSYKKYQNCDKFRHRGSQCRNRKIIKNRDIQKARTSQTNSFVNA